MPVRLRQDGWMFVSGPGPKESLRHQPARENLDHFSMHLPCWQVYFNYRMLVAWLLRGVVHALVNFFVAVFFLGGLSGP